MIEASRLVFGFLDQVQWLPARLRLVVALADPRPVLPRLVGETATRAQCSLDFELAIRRALPWLRGASRDREVRSEQVVPVAAPQLPQRAASRAEAGGSGDGGPSGDSQV